MRTADPTVSAHETPLSSGCFAESSVLILSPVGYYSPRGGIWNGGAIVGTGTSISVGRLASNASSSADASLSGSARIPFAPNASATCAKLGL